MIQCKVFSGATVLTLKIIAFENILPGKINALVGGVYIAVEADDGGHGKALRDGPQLVPIGGAYHLALVQVYKNERPLYRANH